jgi:hypothetical protein
MKRCGFRYLCLLLMLIGSVQAQSPAAVPDEAVRRLAHLVGEWDSRWDWVDKEGHPVGTETGVESARYLIGERVVEITTTIEGRAQPSKAWAFYSDADKLFHLVSVSGTGDLWTLKGGLDRYVITSDPHLNPDGSTMQIRFTHHDIGPDEVRAEMEHSTDNGATWTLGFRQTMTRRGSGAHD